MSFLVRKGFTVMAPRQQPVQLLYTSDQDVLVSKRLQIVPHGFLLLTPSFYHTNWRNLSPEFLLHDDATQCILSLPPSLLHMETLHLSYSWG